MKTVKWSFHTGQQTGIDHPDCIKEIIDEDYKPYVSLSSDILKNRKDVTFIKCPAVTDFMKSTYVFKSPFDLNLNIEVTNNFSEVYIDNISQEIFDNIVDLRFLENQERGQSPHPLIGIDFLSTFTCDTPVMMQVFPAFMHYNNFTSKTCVVPGEYDISKWIRPVELVFEVKNKRERIEIRKGDALCYFKFTANDAIKLEKNFTPWEEITICNDLRNKNKFRPLKERYESYKEHKNGKS